ncbi:hypothetical protein [Flavobacterium johnsoniae]|uniref:hypothetical protein n=1 Tax=Flavobacterium johnsoniae TaxID=986 RepID=UPI0002DE55F8|nr:hypothetical protein [Flavobacterium johnsoniae]WQG82371.1 hypothetical protein SR927_04475 [Flavobacterium johnsoniae UW101]SHK81495.1 hypothetical protein SAMN05444146_2362 [Flavobacterium johnsoniae]
MKYDSSKLNDWESKSYAASVMEKEVKKRWRFSNPEETAVWTGVSVSNPKTGLN